MSNIKKWCSNKENIKILIMIGMAIVLVVILKIRFGGKAVNTQNSTAAPYEAEVASLTQDSVREYRMRIPEKAPERSEKAVYHTRKPPPFLKRDLFSSRNSGPYPKRKTEQMEEINLELTATIIDGQGAVAIIENEVRGLGEMVGGFRVTAIKNNEVILSKGERQYVLRIKEE